MISGGYRCPLYDDDAAVTTADLGSDQATRQLDSATATVPGRGFPGPAPEALQRLVSACEPVSGYLTLLYTQSQDFDANQAKEAWAEIDSEIRQLFERGQREGAFRTDLTAV